MGTLATVAMAVAVTGLRWHYPTDALGGALLGVGIVLLVDGLAHLDRVVGWAHPGPGGWRRRPGRAPVDAP